MFINQIKKALIQVINSSKKTIDFKTIGYLPRWAILAFDFTIILFAITITKVIVNKIKDITYYSILLSKEDFIILLINVFCFILFRTYAGLIRHSTFIDALKFLIATLATVVILIVGHYLCIFFLSKYFFSIPYIIVYGVISFCFLFLFRVLVKQVFDVYLRYLNHEEVIKVLVYGTDENAIGIANALKSEKPTRYQVLGFIDRNQQNKSKEVLGLPIIHLKRSPALILRLHKAQALIIASNNLSKEERLKIVDSCLDYKFKVFVAPLVSDIEETKSLSNQIQKIQIEDILEREQIKLDNKLVAKEIFGKNILVTGGAGSIGSEIVRQVANYNPSNLIILDQAESPLYRIQLEIKQNFPELSYVAVIGDIRDSVKLKDVFEKYKPDIIYHAAAYKHVPLMEQYPSQAVLSNIIGTKNTADLALEFSADKFVMVSTDKAVNPSNVMGATKRIAEIYVQSLQEKVSVEKIKQTQFVTTRFGNVLGSNGSVVPLFKRQLEKGGPLTITHPDIIRYFMTIPEACQLVLEAGAMGNGGEIFIFDMGKAVKIIDLAKKIIMLAGYEPYKDIDIKVIGLRPGEKLYEELLNDKSQTLPTYNKKIMIAKIDVSPFNLIQENLNSLLKLIEEKDNFKLVEQMKKIVPEFKSMNSEFESMD